MCVYCVNPWSVHRFSAIPSHKYPEGSTPSQVTHYHLDLSYTLDTMLRTQYNNRMYKDLNINLKILFVFTPT